MHYVRRTELSAWLVRHDAELGKSLVCNALRNRATPPALSAGLHCAEYTPDIEL